MLARLLSRLTLRVGTGQREDNPCPAGIFLVDPDRSTVVGDDPLANRKANSGAIVLVVVMQAPKDLKHLIGETRLDANAVVSHRHLHHAVIDETRVDGDLQPGFFALEFDGVADEILNDVADQDGFAFDQFTPPSVT